ncbi:hypothetical protein [Hoeflea olei]|nr:hypothetical protein [Hoeflea olei]
MSEFLGNCLRGAIASAFGMALMSFIFTIVTIAILGAVTGPGDVIAVAAALPLALVAAGIFGAVVFISLVLACVRADGRRADVQAGAPGGGGQALEEDKDEEPKRCLICEKIRKQLTLAGPVVGIAIGLGIGLLAS